MDLADASREELLAALVERDAAIEELRAALVERDARLMELAGQAAALQARLGRDSSNSSRPPSSDPPYTKQTKRGLRGSSRCAGGDAASGR